MVPLYIAKFLRTSLLQNTSGGYFWQSYNSTVKSPVCSLILRLFVLSILIKNLHKMLHKQSRDKEISSLLELIDNVPSISEYVLEKH